MKVNNENHIDEHQDYYDKKQEKAWKNFKYDMKFFGVILLSLLLYYLFFS